LAKIRLRGHRKDGFPPFSISGEVGGWRVVGGFPPFSKVGGRRARENATVHVHWRRKNERVVGMATSQCCQIGNFEHWRFFVCQRLSKWQKIFCWQLAFGYLTITGG